MRTKNVMVFAYDFPHKKTQDFLLRLIIEGYNIKYVIAAPWKKLNIPSPTIRISPCNTGLIHPQVICKRFRIPYKSLDHNSRECIDFLKKNVVDLYIISGARILSKDVIKASRNKILNIHVGMLPEARGLDTLLWSIRSMLPIGLSAHFINEKVDRGELIYREKLEIKKDDTLIDISLRLLEHQPDFLIKSLDILKHIDKKKLVDLNELESAHFTKMPSSLEKKTVRMFAKWRERFSE